MANQDLINTSIDEYLISLANSISQAQRHISNLQITTQDGKSAISYQLPQVEFELKMSFILTKKRPPSGAPARDIAKAEGGGYLQARPLDPASSTSSTAEVASTVKGSFIAVPIQGGKPPPVIRTSLARRPDNPLDFAITVTVQSAVGENLAGIDVQFNVDRELFARLNAESNSGLPREVHVDTGLRYGVRRTDADGKAVNELRVGEKEIKDTSIPIVIDVLGETETIVVKPAVLT